MGYWCEMIGNQMNTFIMILILLATVEFNKQLIDNVIFEAKEQREWHYAQLLQWIVIYGGIMLLTKAYWEIIIFGCFYPLVYDTLLNLRRGFKWDYEGEHDLPKYIKYGLSIVGIVLIIIKELGI